MGTACGRRGLALPGVEIEPQLPARLDQPVALPQQDLLALDDHRKLGQRPGDAGQIAGQRRQLLLDRPRRHAGRQQFGQPPGRGHLLEIEVRQPPHLAHRHDQPPPMPAANHRHRHAQQFGQHGRRVEPVDVLLRFDQPQPLPELRFGDDLDRALLDLPPRGLVEPVVLLADVRQRKLLLADDDQMGRSVGLLQHRRPVLADQLRGVALGHAGQLAHKGEALPCRVSEEFSAVDMAFDVAGRLCPSPAVSNKRAVVHGSPRIYTARASLR